MALHWYCALTHQGKDTFAKLNLEQQGFETYLPVCKEFRIERGVKRARIKPFVPGYIFPRLDLDDHQTRWQSVWSTMGIKGVIVAGDRPQVVHDWIIEGIREREVDGFVKLEPKETCKFKNGDPVRVVGSPLDAIFVEMEGLDRATILVSLFNKQVPKSVMLSKLRTTVVA